MAAVDSTDLYLSLLKECLIGRIYGPEVVHVPDDPEDPGMREAIAVMNSQGIAVTRSQTLAEEVYAVGRNFGVGSQRAATLIGRARLDNVHQCVDHVIREGVPGDLIETGVWRGGTTILMRAIVKARGDDRLVWLADSFAGLPDPDTDAYPLDSEFVGHGKLDIGIEDVREQFERYALLDDGVRFLEGWFKDTLPTLGSRQFAVVRLDGDMYESTIQALEQLYPRLSPGGFMIVDDYGAYNACRQAVTDYREAHSIDDLILGVDWTGVYWRKSG
jgi:O-methyltransferase